MNSKEYWEQRVILKDKLLEKDISKAEKELLKLFKNSKKEVLNELKIIYSDIESTEYQKYRIDSLLTSINNSLDNLYNKSEKEITEGLKDVYKTMYQEANIDLKASFNTINENLIEEVAKTNLGTKLNESRDIFVLHNEVLDKIVDDLIASNWSGLTLVERILEHKRKLSLTLKEELSKGLIRGDSLQDISRILSKKMDLSYSNALRIVRTESCWVMNEATINNYKNNGIKEYEFMAFLDKKTSPQCRELDGKIISVEEYKAGLNFPPLHPNCRSCIVPVIEESIKPVEEKPKKVTREIKGKESEKVKLSPIEVLKNKGVTIKEDTFKGFDKKLLDENMKQFAYLIDKYSIVSDYIKERSIEFKGINIKSSTIAQVESNIHKDKLILSLNNKFYENYNRTIKDHMDNIKKGWSSKSSEKYLPVQSITHEFGHIIHDCIIHNYNKENPKKLEKVVTSSMKGSLSAGKKKLKDYQLKIVREYNKEMIAIAKELDQGFSIEKSLSKYGKTDSFEFFAECFAEYECGANTTISKAMEEMLRRRGIIK